MKIMLQAFVSHPQLQKTDLPYHLLYIIPTGNTRLLDKHIFFNNKSWQLKKKNENNILLWIKSLTMIEHVISEECIWMWIAF